MRNIKVLLLSLITGSIFAQTLPSPSASSVIRGINVPVDHYSGVPNISIPIFDLAHHKGSSIPIGLTYHAGGIKVQDIAGPVGLGWRLTGGGLITRVVRGAPDTENNYLIPTTNSEKIDVAYGDKDGEKDLFYFQIPGGGGKFIVDGSNGYTMPFQEVLIEKIGTFDTGHWIITDQSGNKYYFGQSSSSKEESTMRRTSGLGTEVEEDYISTWYLNKIDLFNSPYDITFNYGTYSSYSFYSYGETLEVHFPLCGTNPTSTSYSTDNHKVDITDPKYLTSIVTRLGKAEFKYNTTRLDIGSAYLDEIVIKDYLNNEITKFDLDHSYFDASDAFNGFFHPFSSDNPSLNEDWYRLKLDKISETANGLTQLLASFTYLNDQTYDICDNCTDPAQYDLYELPPRHEYGVDHYGFFNAQRSPSFKNLPEMKNKNGATVIQGASKYPDEEFAKANMLKSIHFPSGGYKEFEFEINKVNNINYSGLRIKKIKTADAEGNLLEQNYNYHNSGVGFETPLYYFTVYSDGSNTFILDDNKEATDCEPATAFIFSNSLTNLFDLGGVAQGYAKVEVTDGSGGSTIYNYFTADDYPDDKPSISGEGISIRHGRIDRYYGPPFVPQTSRYWKRGLQKSIEVKNSTGDKILNESRDYFFDESRISRYQNTKVHHLLKFIDQSEFTNTFVVGKYFSDVYPIMLKSVTNNIISDIDQTRFEEVTDEYTYVTTTSFGYDVRTAVKEKTTTILNGDEIIVNYKYPTEFTQNCTGCSDDLEAIHKLRTNHIITPIETIESTKVGSQTLVTGAQLTKFNSEGFVSKIYNLRTGTGLANYSEASISSNSLLIDSRLELSNSYIYNSTTKNISSVTDDGSGLSTNYEYEHQDVLIKSESTGQFETKYEHYPLVGIKKITDHNGHFITRHYDPLNRLQYVTDENGDIIETYRIHYANQDYTPTATFDISGLNKPDENVTFQYTGPEPMNGTNRYVWDFGDGNIDESSARTIQHQYSIAGEYSPSLTVINAEYDQNPQQSLPINIYDTPYDFTIANTDGSAGLGYVVEATGVLGYSCGNPQFSWKYRISGAWLNLPVSGHEVLIDVAEGETWQVQLHVVDDCDVSATSNIITLVGPEEGGSDPSQN